MKMSKAILKRRPMSVKPAEFARHWEMAFNNAPMRALEDKRRRLLKTPADKLPIPF